MLSRSIAWGRTDRIAASEVSAPATLPGRLMTRVLPMHPQTARLRMAVGVCFRPSARILSLRPSTVRSQTISVASGVTSRGAIPVPPVVTMRLASAAWWRRA